MQQTAQTTISVSALVQLYAPLVGLLVMAFWLGVLSQRVKVTERRQEKAEVALEAAKLESMTVAVLASKFDDMKETIEKMEREMRGMQRTLANAFSGKVGTIHKFEQDEG